jgi:hypothetical protein|tara:strand:- start:209 stop:742 length:534 start_codon:yes stop_codon:yes gene_type:complete
MAHFAKLGVNGKVIAVHGLDNDQMLNADGQEDESVGQNRLQEIHGWPASMWIQTSYNTKRNKYFDADGSEAADQSKALRGNYAGIGDTWDEDNQIFWRPQPHASWTKDTSTASWKSPIDYPSVVNDGQDPVVWEYEITWNETLYQSDNSKGWEAYKDNDTAETKTMFDWNGSAWVQR